MEEFKPVVFLVGGQRFGIDIGKVQGIEKEQRVVPVPNTEEYINGIINLRGEVIPVYSLKKKFNIQAETSPNPQYIIVWIKGTTMAIEVDGVDEIHKVEPDTLRAIPSLVGDGETGYIQNVVNDGEDLIIIVNIDKLLTESELKRLDELSKQDKNG